MFTNQIDEYGSTEQLTDSVLHSLQQNNELILAFAVETNAWVRAVNYKVLAMNKDQWKGYTYYVNNTTHISSGLKPAEVSNDTCNSLWNFFQTREVPKIIGDNGENYCIGDKKNNCNINDGATWRLILLTKNKVIDLSFYEPEYYENCCPGNADRELFLQAVNKIKAIVPDKKDAAM